MTWYNNLPAQPGDFSPILNTITPADGACLQAIYDTILAHVESQPLEREDRLILDDYITQGISVSMESQILENGIINIPSIATLVAMGLIRVSGNHVGLSRLGYEFLSFVLTQGR